MMYLRRKKKTDTVNAVSVTKATIRSLKAERARAQQKGARSLVYALTKRIRALEALIPQSSDYAC